MSISGHHGPIKIRDPAVVNGSTASPDYDFMKTDVSHSHRINIYHPAYAPGDDVLLTPSGFDHPEGGIHHGFALSLGIWKTSCTDVLKVLLGSVMHQVDYVALQINGDQASTYGN
jgi:hypothetical protein